MLMDVTSTPISVIPGLSTVITGIQHFGWKMFIGWRNLGNEHVRGKCGV